tara:strand:+ start:690 stop:1037 length:348 start_codon:yes stop_codon:yes gene_type:complete
VSHFPKEIKLMFFCVPLFFCTCVTPATCLPIPGVTFEGVDSDKVIASQGDRPLAVVYVSSYMPRPPYTFRFFGPELCDKGANSIMMIKGGFYRATFIKYFEPPTGGGDDEALGLP